MSLKIVLKSMSHCLYIPWTPVMFTFKFFGKLIIIDCQWRQPFCRHAHIIYASYWIYTVGIISCSSLSITMNLLYYPNVVLYVHQISSLWTSSFLCPGSIVGQIICQCKLSCCILMYNCISIHDPLKVLDISSHIIPICRVIDFCFSLIPIMRTTWLHVL